MQVDDLGSCSGTMMFPVNEQYEVRLAAVVTGGGESRRVDLGGWTDISAVALAALRQQCRRPYLSGGRFVFRF